MDQYRKTIGAAALLLVEVAALWVGAPDWVLTLVPGLMLLVTWGLPNAPTDKQAARVLAAYHAETGR